MKAKIVKILAVIAAMTAMAALSSCGEKKADENTTTSATVNGTVIEVTDSQGNVESTFVVDENGSVVAGNAPADYTGGSNGSNSSNGSNGSSGGSQGSNGTAKTNAQGGAAKTTASTVEYVTDNPLDPGAKDIF